MTSEITIHDIAKILNIDSSTDEKELNASRILDFEFLSQNRLIFQVLVNTCLAYSFSFLINIRNKY